MRGARGQIARCARPGPVSRVFYRDVRRRSSTCTDCFIRAYYVPSLSLALVQQRFATTPVIIRDANYPWLQSFSEVMLLLGVVACVTEQ